jgi:hypothetical protein
VIGETHDPALAQDSGDRVFDLATSIFVANCEISPSGLPTASSVFQPVRDCATPFKSVTFPFSSVVMTASPMLAKVVCSQSRDRLQRVAQGRACRPSVACGQLDEISIPGNFQCCSQYLPDAIQDAARSPEAAGVRDGPGDHAAKCFVSGDQSPVGIDRERWIWFVAPQDQIDGGDHCGILQRTLRKGGSIPRRHERRVPIAQMNIQSLREILNHLPARTGTTGLEKAEMARRDFGIACEIKLA